ncbi:MAG TPA: zf-HC2 domain-containing protein [Candidatus Polarisedimenticolia bacterium]|nr:zf-HC2 domain-containing protein [Candidatus Polarisedimenticolia bacterium]
MINCHDFVAFLMEYLEGELAPEQAEYFEAHLSICAACVNYLRTYRETIRLGKFAFTDPAADVPPEVPAELVQAILEARKRS